MLFINILITLLRNRMSIRTDQSLEDFLDGEGLGNAQGENKLSTDAYVQWGRRRSEMILMDNFTTLEFVGRNDTIGSLFDNVYVSILNPVEKNPIHFIHGSSGVGKTRLFVEMVKMESDQQKHLLSNDLNIDGKKALVDDTLHIAISMHGRTPYEPLYNKLTTMPDFLYHVVIRILHIWLTDSESLDDVYAAVVAALESGDLPEYLLTLESVLSLVACRAGRKNIVLYVDEILKINDSNLVSNLVRKLAAAQDMYSASPTLRVYFSAVKADIFAMKTSYCGRDIISTPLCLLSRNDTLSLATYVVNTKADPYLYRRSLLVKDQYIEVISRLSGGHMRSMEFLAEALENVWIHSNVLHYFHDVMHDYNIADAPYMHGAVLLSLLGHSVYDDTGVRDSVSDRWTTVKDMVANGQLIAAVSKEETTRSVVVNMPLISFIGWAFSTYNTYYDNTRSPALEAARIISNFVNELIPPTVDHFKIVWVMRQIVMRYVYRSVMDENTIRNATEIDWRRATLKDYFKHNRSEGPISAELGSLTFDFTELLMDMANYDKQNLLNDDEKGRKFFAENYDKKLTRIAQCTNNNFQGIDYFLSLVSNCGVVVTVAVQMIVPAEHTVVKFNDASIKKLLEKARNVTTEYGVPRNTIISVAELWCVNPWRGDVGKQLNVENAFVQTKVELEKQAGPLFTDLMSFSDLFKN